MPDRVNGIIVWNHGISGTSPSWRTPAPPALRLLLARGWDVIMLKRHHLAETMPGGPLNRSVEQTLQEAVAQRKAGYRKVVLAGQSFAGYVTLEAIDRPLRASVRSVSRGISRGADPARRPVHLPHAGR